MDPALWNNHGLSADLRAYSSLKAGAKEHLDAKVALNGLEERLMQPISLGVQALTSLVLDKISSDFWAVIRKTM